MPSVRTSMQTVALALLWCGAASAQLISPAEEMRLIEQVKGMSASELDSTQPAVPLEAWLQETFEFPEPPDWQTGSCDLKPVHESRADIHLCVEVRGTPDPGGFGARFHVLIGNFAQGAIGKPSVHRAIRARDRRRAAGDREGHATLPLRARRRD